MTFLSRDQKPTCAEVPLLQVPAPHFRGERFQTEGQSGNCPRALQVGTSWRRRGGGVRWDRGGNWQRLQRIWCAFQMPPPLTPIHFGAGNCMSVGGEIWVPSLISLDKCGLMAERNGRRRRHLFGMTTNPQAPADPWGGGWQRAKTRAGPGLDSLYPFLPRWPYVWCKKRRAWREEMERDQGLRMGTRWDLLGGRLSH